MKGKEQSNIHEPCLQWVRVQGEIRYVSDFKDLEIRDRPEAYCPICGRNVILKLGPERAHHAAHYEGAICAATQPETAIHLNSKYYLQKILGLTDQVKIWQGCDGWAVGTYHTFCYEENRHEVLYIQNWDRVEVEWTFGKYRLDVALLNGEYVVGAIEVLVTHPSEREKIEYLNQQGIAWVEIRVTPDFYTAPTAWTVDTPLETENYNRSLVEAWRCEHCTSAMEEHKKSVEETNYYQEEKESKKAYAQQFEIVAVRLIDFYYSSGKKYRSVFVIQNRVKDGNILYAELQEAGTQRRTIARQLPSISAESYERLRTALKVDIKKKRENNTIIDDSTSWVEKPERFHPKKFLDTDRYPYKYDLIDGKWKKVESKPYYFPEMPSHYFTPHADNSSQKVKEPSVVDRPRSFLDNEYPCEKCGKVTSDWVSAKHGIKTCICRECSEKPSQ